MTPSVIAAMVSLRLRRILKDRTSVVWLIGMPMVFSFLMGQMLGDWSGGPGKLPRFLVFDLDGSAAADSLLAPLLENERFHMVRADSTTSETAVLDAIQQSRITAALFIPAGFADPAGANETVSVDTTLRFYYDSDRLSSQTVRSLLEKSILKRNTISAAETLVWLDLQTPVPDDRSGQFDRAGFESRWNDPRVAVQSRTLGRIEEEGLVLNQASQHAGPAYTIFFILMFLMMSAKDLVDALPVRTAARRPKTVSHHVLAIHRRGRYVFEQRPSVGLVAERPEVEELRPVHAPVGRAVDRRVVVDDLVLPRVVAEDEPEVLRAARRPGRAHADDRGDASREVGVERAPLRFDGRPLRGHPGHH